MVYGTSPIKRRRSTKAEIAALDDAIYQACAAEHPLTVRSAFYRVVSAGAVDKSEAGYRRVQLRVLELRRSGRVPYWWITDGTRYRQRPKSWSSLQGALDAHAAAYRRDLWDLQPVYVEIWAEKDAISGTLWPVTHELDVSLMITRGYSSESFLHQSAEEIAEVGKPTIILNVGDRDPSGVDAWAKVRQSLSAFAPDIDFTFERVAVTEAQIVEYDLPTRPTKKSDTRAAKFEGDSVEVDAIAPSVLRDLLRTRIEALIDPHQLRIVQEAERSERDIMRRIAGRSA